MRLEVIEENPPQIVEPLDDTSNNWDHLNDTKPIMRFNSERDSSFGGGLLKLHKMASPDKSSPTQMIEIISQSEQETEKEYSDYHQTIEKCKDLFGAILMTNSPQSKGSPRRRMLGFGSPTICRSPEDDRGKNVKKYQFNEDQYGCDGMRVKRLIASPDGPSLVIE